MRQCDTRDAVCLITAIVIILTIIIIGVTCDMCFLLKIRGCNVGDVLSNIGLVSVQFITKSVPQPFVCAVMTFA